MSRYKRWLVFFLSLCLLCSCTVLPSHATTQEMSVSVSAQSAVLIEAESGEIVYQKNCNTPLPMASTTKIMTALTALSIASPDRVIATDARAVGVEGSSIYLTVGEKLTLEELLYALLLESANDAAAAIAIGLSGSIEAFADEMNAQARALGLTQTHFQNPHGLDDEDHYTTAYELALITRAALQNELIRTIVSTYKTTISHADAENGRLLVNHNKMLRQYEGCIGVKTGFTKRSGRTLVCAAERNGVTLISVTLNAPDDWNDHTVMLDYGFTQYRREILCQAEEILYPMQVVGGRDGYVMLGNREALALTLPSNAGTVTQTIECRHFEYAPILEAQAYGTVVFRCDTDGDGTTEVIATLPLYALYSVERYEKKQGFWEWLIGLFS